MIIEHEDDNASLIAYVEKLRNAITKSVEKDDISLPISASFGVSFFPDDGKNPRELIKHADLAMYCVKNSGGDGVCQYKTKCIHD